MQLGRKTVFRMELPFLIFSFLFYFQKSLIYKDTLAYNSKIHKIHGETNNKTVNTIISIYKTLVKRADHVQTQALI